MKKLLLILASILAFACGGLDITDPDTHVFRVTIVDNFDGTSEVIEEDLGFDRDAYVAAMEDQERINDAYWQWAKSGPAGSTHQAVTISGRYGIDSQTGSAATEQRCPNNPPYTGNPASNPNGNYCTVAASKSNPYWVDASIENWDYRFSGYSSESEDYIMNIPVAQSLTANNSGTGWTNYLATTYASSLYRIRDSSTCSIACVSNDVSPIVLAQPTGARVRKRKADSAGWFGTVNLNFANMYAGGTLSDNQTQTQRNNILKNIVRHEVGHIMGLGHRPQLSGEARNTMMLNAGLSTQYNFMSDQKSECSNYVP